MYGQTSSEILETKIKEHAPTCVIFVFLWCMYIQKNCKKNNELLFNLLPNE